ncbi:MAG: purine-nucleoside phosphorylase [Bacteroidetes bacterium]|nr:purine-nucleoside phosphorylase [Bacteroidota bacterium]MBS1540049.1 purine-nucleoside phosphorylase [Bacteroidota bacterium]
MLNQINEAVSFIQNHGITQPEIGVILGTGLGNRFVKEIKNQVVINYNSIPHFPISTVESHKGKLIYGDLKGKKVLAMQGRFHYYEGYDMQQITLPVRVMKFLGIDYLLISNAAGCLNLDWKKGELMLIDDHLNLQPDNPLRGVNFEILGPRFPDMSRPYAKKLNDYLLAIAKKKKIKLHTGVYVAVQGPNLETRAEYRFLKTIGADAVGMSTVPEVLVANHMGLPCCAVSVLTDECDPDNLKPVDLKQIIATASRSEGKLTELYIELIGKL